jgi:hypothetical protein
MSVELLPTKRIKPPLLREQKTEALLVFIRTLLDQLFTNIKTEDEFHIKIGTKEDTKVIYDALMMLHKELQSCVVDATYLKVVLQKKDTSAKFKILHRTEEPLITYYNSLTKVIENQLSVGKRWLPEVIIISMLSQWVLEEQKSTYLYSFLNKIDYIGLIEQFDYIKLSQDSDKKELIMQMYKLSTLLIEKLKQSTHKSKKKKRKKK